ncbi:MAG: hypothetical protein ACPGFA_13070, partial [Pikeienuella sp.]
FVDAENCISPVSSVEGGKGMLAYREISNNLGREPDSMLAFYTIGSVSLPSGTGSEGRGPGFDTLVLNGLEYAITPEGLKLPRPSGLEKPTLRPPGITQTLRSFGPVTRQSLHWKRGNAWFPDAARRIDFIRHIFSRQSRHTTFSALFWVRLERAVVVLAPQRSYKGVAA